MLKVGDSPLPGTSPACPGWWAGRGRGFSQKLLQISAVKMSTVQTSVTQHLLIILLQLLLDMIVTDGVYTQILELRRYHFITSMKMRNVSTENKLQNLPTGFCSNKRGWSPLTMLLTFLRMLVRPLMTRENLYLEMLIRHSLLCSVLTLVWVFWWPTLMGSWRTREEQDAVNTLFSS